jgi:hypothetical protein
MIFLNPTSSVHLLVNIIVIGESMRNNGVTAAAAAAAAQQRNAIRNKTSLRKFQSSIRLVMIGMTLLLL